MRASSRSFRRLLVGSPYPAFVPKTDADGNDVAGIRLPEVAVPLATYYRLGRARCRFAGDDLCDAAGQKIDFPQTKAERLAAGDPRPLDRGTISEPSGLREAGGASRNTSSPRKVPVRRGHEAVNRGRGSEQRRPIASRLRNTVSAGLSGAPALSNRRHRERSSGDTRVQIEQSRRRHLP